MRIVVAVALMVGCDDVFHLREVPESIDAPSGASDAAGTGPEALYDFEDVHAGLPDVTGHGHDGVCATASCPSSTVGAVGRGNAGAFDGTMEIDIAPFVMQAFTVTVAMRMDTSGAAMCPINRVYGAIGYNSWQLCATQYSFSNTARLGFYTVDAPTDLESDVPMTLGTWHHFAIRWDGTTKSVFFDGVEIISGPGTTQYDGHRILVGRDFDDPSPVAAVNGALDDIAIYTRALDNAEIRALAR